MQKNKTKMNKKVYISGPISGLDRKEVIENFSNADLLLRKNGYATSNPTNALVFRHPRIYRLIERLLGEERAYRAVLVYDLWLLSRSDSICMIDGWQLSRGAKIEEGFAFRLGIVRSHTYDPKQQKLMPFQKDKKKRKLDEQQPVSEAAAAVAALGNAMSRMGGSNKKNELKRNK